MPAVLERDDTLGAIVVCHDDGCNIALNSGHWYSHANEYHALVLAARHNREEHGAQDSYDVVYRPRYGQSYSGARIIVSWWIDIYDQNDNRVWMAEVGNEGTCRAVSDTIARYNSHAAA